LVLLSELRKRLQARTAAELSWTFEKAGLPYAPMAKPEELFDDPHLMATGGLTSQEVLRLRESNAVA